jgi:hypothetical protein
VPFCKMTRSARRSFRSTPITVTVHKSTSSHSPWLCQWLVRNYFIDWAPLLLLDGKLRK